MSAFSDAFVRLRRAAGFETAYQFFHQNGGAKSFGCTFQNYLRIEKGTNLPVPGRLPKLCALLRLPLDSAERRSLVRSYVVTWAGGSDLADWFLSPFQAPPPPAPTATGPAGAALKKVVRDWARPIGLDAFRAIVESEASYGCYRVLVTSNRGQSEKDLASILGLSGPDIRKGLETLSKAGLAEKAKDGAWSSPLAGQFLVFPDTSILPAALLKRVEVYNEKMVKRKGAVVDRRWCGVRADAASMEGFLSHFRDAIRSVNAYATAEKTDRSALYLVEGRVLKLFDF